MGRTSVVRLSTIFILSLVSAAWAQADDDHHRRCLNIDRPTTIGTDQRCVRVTKKVTGDVVNNAVVGRSDNDKPGFFIGGKGLITGALINNGTIQGGGEGLGALTLGRNADVKGGIENNGTIVSANGNAINLGFRDDDDDWWEYEAAALTGDITNRGLIDGHDDGIAALFGTMSGRLINESAGVIKGGAIGVHIFDTFSSWTGGIENRGLIQGGASAIVIENDVFEGGLFNAALASIKALDGDGVFATAAWSGGLENRGNIEGTRDGFAYAGSIFAGHIANSGSIEGGRTGLRLAGTTLDGALTNSGDIEGGVTGVAILFDEVLGQFLNNGTIDGGTGTGVEINVATWGRAADPADIVNAAAGQITGGTSGFAITAGTVFGNFINNGRISGGGTAVSIVAGAFRGDIENRGLIEGGTHGIVIESGVFEGGLFNAALATVKALDGDGVFASAAWSGAFENGGNIEGTRDGFAYAGSSFAGDVLNSGSIEGGRDGVRLAGATFDGAFTNSGDIDGGRNGVALLFDHVLGQFLNNGAIDGGTGAGVEIDVATWGSEDDPADIINAAAGRITGGETGFSLTAGTVFGNFINDGKIAGGGTDTGISIVAGTFNGDIENNGEAEAPSNAMHLDIGTLNGQVRNTGTVRATLADGVAVNLNIGNGTTFKNADGGLIFGDVLLGGPAANTFVAQDGGVEGDIVGTPFEGKNDRLIVAGEHYFVDGALLNLLRFDVNDGGAALMGARFIGDPDGPGYASANVGALNVAAGGHLYLDDDTILNVGTYTQSADSELTLFLVAPASGDPVAGTDYGRIDASGAVTLAGSLALILDPASFGGTTETEFNYVDIIKGASFNGEFDATRIDGSSFFFTLAVTYGDTSIDLSVTRTPFDQTFCEQHLSSNSEDLGAALEAAFLAGGFTPAQIELFNFLGQLEDVCSAYFDLGGAVLGDVHQITVETAGPWKSAVNDRLNSTGATSCVVAGEGGCLTRHAANEVGATVLSDAEDPFAWLDTGLRPEGQLSFWGRLIGVQGDNRGRGAGTGSDFTVTGGIAGADYVFTQRFIAGVAAQWTNTDVDFKHRSDTADVQSFEVGGYFSYGDVDFCINGNASIIFHDFDTYRFLFGETAHGAYEGQTISAYTEAGTVFEIGRFRLEPVGALAFAALETDDYAETGTAGGNLLIVQGADHQSLRSYVGARFAYPFSLESGRKIVPEARVMWAHEFLDDQSRFVAALSSLPNNRFTVRGQEFARDGLLAGVGLNLPLSSQAVVYADYDLALSRDQAIQSVSLGARVSW